MSERCCYTCKTPAGPPTYRYIDRYLDSKLYVRWKKTVNLQLLLQLFVNPQNSMTFSGIPSDTLPLSLPLGSHFLMFYIINTNNSLAETNCFITMEQAYPWAAKYYLWAYLSTAKEKEKKEFMSVEFMTHSWFSLLVFSSSFTQPFVVSISV